MSINISEIKNQLKKTSKSIQYISRLVNTIEKLEKNPLSIHNTFKTEKVSLQLLNYLSSHSNFEIIDYLNEWIVEFNERLQNNKAENKRNFGIELENSLKNKPFSLTGHCKSSGKMGHN